MKSKHAVISALFTLAALSAGPVSAQSACKGLSESACGTASSCSWVKGYTRKDGREVASYCRVKSKPKAAAAEQFGKKLKPKG
jgi:hypothetical protein